MAKMFYTMDETKSALGRGEEEVRQLAREGRLREFRDGPRLMFKADQVEQLKAELSGGGDMIGLAPDSAPIGLAGDTRTGSGSPVSGAPTKQDTHFADIGLSGGLGGLPSPGKAAPGSGLANLPGSGTGTGLPGLTGTGLSGTGLSSGGRGGGITIFDVDETDKVDPSAQTVINQGIKDQLNLESVGSGSGLLELSRESDDTSLGAVFDELTPAKPGRAGATIVPPSAGGARDDEETAMIRGSLAAPVYVEAADPLGTAIGAMSLVGAAVVLFGMFILGATLLGFRPDIMADLEWEKSGKTYLMLAFGVTMVAGGIGFAVGKLTSRPA